MKFNPKNLIILTGQSGAGKTTIAKEILKKHKGGKKFVNHTSRKKRSGEHRGREYNFVSKKEFEKMIKNFEFFEWAKVYGNYYGNSKKLLEECCDKNKFCIITTDIQGAKTFKKKLKNAKILFITVSQKELLRRLKERGDKEEDIKIRLKIAEKELKEAQKFKYIIENKKGKLKQAVDKIYKILNL